MSDVGLCVGAPVLLYLQAPKEKVWGLLVAILAPGVVVRGLDLNAFEDWMRQEAKGEEALIGPTTLFYPMNRLERLERDETVGPVPSYSDRFEREVGRSVREAMGMGMAAEPPPAAAGGS